MVGDLQCYLYLCVKDLNPFVYVLCCHGYCRNFYYSSNLPKPFGLLWHGFKFLSVFSCSHNCIIICLLSSSWKLYRHCCLVVIVTLSSVCAVWTNNCHQKNNKTLQVGLYNICCIWREKLHCTNPSLLQATYTVKEKILWVKICLLIKDNAILFYRLPLANQRILLQV